MINTFKSIYRREMGFVEIAKVWDDLLDRCPKEDSSDSSTKKD